MKVSKAAPMMFSIRSYLYGAVLKAITRLRRLFGLSAAYGTRGHVATRFAEPARRTYEDAETLLGKGRLGTSDHLYGLACECALKAILTGLGVITADPPQRPFKSHVDSLWAEYAAALAGRSASLLSVPATNPFHAWKADDRYWDDSQFTQVRVCAHKLGAEVGMQLLQHAQTQGIVT